MQMKSQMRQCSTFQTRPRWRQWQICALESPWLHLPPPSFQLEHVTQWVTLITVRASSDPKNHCKPINTNGWFPTIHSVTQGIIKAFKWCNRSNHNNSFVGISVNLTINNMKYIKLEPGSVKSSVWVKKRFKIGYMDMGLHWTLKHATMLVCLQFIYL